MEQRDFMTRAKQLVVDYFNSHVDATDGKKLTMEDVFIVWFSKTLQNWKALVSTTVSDGMYYEITHNGDKKETTSTCTRSGRTSALRTETPHIDGGAVWTASSQA